MIDENQYQETLNYLYSFIDYSLQRNFRYAPEKFDLGRMHHLAESLGNPHQSYPVIHVAGTKGKGSVAALGASALRAGGYRTGLYTSPHLQDYTERIQVDGEPIPQAELVRLVEEIKPVFTKIPEISTFEITTALAFLYFSRMQVDAAVIEVGLGGRLDATNIVTPVVSVITSLSYDHTDLLGNTLGEIAGEKAGIIKPGRPVVLSPQKEEARQVVHRIARERNSPLIQVGDDVRFAPLEHSLEGQSFLVWNKGEDGSAQEYINTGEARVWQPIRLEIPLLGLHQVENGATAYAALRTADSNGLQISETAIKKGFAGTRWAGRFELLQRDPVVIVDSAHNRDSALKLRQTLDDYFPGSPVVLLFGASEDKDIQGILEELLPRVSLMIATQSFHPRATDPTHLVDMFQQFGRPARAVPVIEEALQEALLAAGDRGIVVATGSIFVAAAVRAVWQQIHKPESL